LEFDSAGEASELGQLFFVQPIFRPSMRPRFLLLCSLAFAALVLLAGCERAAAPFAAETDDRNYTRGKAFLREGRPQEALASFLKAIADRGDAAPESHLEAGILYQQEVKDPVAAIYHYRKYRELKPSTPQNEQVRELVRQRIDSALRDFARSLPGQLLEGATSGSELLGAVDRLQRENQQLRDQLAVLGAKPPVTLVPGGGTSPLVAVTAGPSSATSTGSAGATPPPAPRTHVIAAGDTLSTIAQKYYGNRAKYRQIFEANRDVMRDENTLPPIGRTLKIP
jgi:LysM repeat protein